jgi:hypothetical protein
MSVDKKEQLAFELAELTDGLAALAEDLQGAANALLDEGQLPDDGLTLHIQKVVDSFAQLKDRLLQELTASGLDVPLAPPANAIALEELLERLGAHLDSEDARVLGDIRRRALDLLETVLSLVHRNRAEFGPLVECQVAARAIRDEILAMPAPAQHPLEPSLADRSHPMGALADLVEAADLDDAAAASRHSKVSEHFGALMAAAAVRGNLERQVVVPADSSPVPLTAVGPTVQPHSGESDRKTEQVESPTVVRHAEPTQLNADNDADRAAPSAKPPESNVLASGVGSATSPSESTAPVVRSSTQDTSSGSLATQLLAAPSKECLNALVWELLGENRASLALQAVKYGVDTSSSQGSPTFAPWMLRPVILAPHVGYPMGDVFRALRDDYAMFDDRHFAADDRDWNHGIRFLLAAGALRPALVAPGTGVSAVLRNLHVSLDRTHQLLTVLANHADRLQPLDIASFRGASSEAEWETQRRALVSESDAWLRESRLRTLIFTGATDVWRRWLSEKGVIGEWIAAVRHGDVSRVEAAVADGRRYQDDVAFRELVRRTDRQEIKRRAGQEITAKALSQLRRGLSEACDLVTRAADLDACRPGQGKAYLVTQAREIQRSVSELYLPVCAELRAFAELNRSTPVAATVPLLVAAVADIHDLVLSGRTVREEPDPVELVQSALLKCRGLEFDDQLNPIEDDHVVRVALLTMLAGKEPSWDEALDLHTQVQDHDATARIIDRMARGGADPDRVEALRVSRDGNLQQLRDALVREVNAVRSRLGRALSFGALTEADRLHLEGRLSSLEAQVVRTTRFGVANRALADLSARLEELRSAQSATIRQTLQAEDVGRNHPAHSRIDAALSAGDFITANEYLDYVRRGEALPEPDNDESAFERFFPQRLQRLSSDLEGAAASTVIESIARGDALGGVDFAADEVDRGVASRVAKHWLSAIAQGRIENSEAKAILNHLGYDVRDVSRSNREGRHMWFNAHGAEMADRERCPAPAFGSLAGGRYRLLCVWNKPSEEDLLLEVDAGSQGQPVIVFYFGTLSEARRRGLAHLCRIRPRPAVVVDTPLLLFLLAETTNRLRALYQCALPFCGGEPYSTTAGLVPVEMFFGRHRELRSVLDPRGSCFIYGGRQLGKTALLRHAVRTFNNPASGKVALWIDLRPVGIGLSRKIEDLWAVIAVELKRLGVLRPQVPDHVKEERLAQEVVAWLDGDKQRRVVLMLDEADRFLEADSETAFSESAKLKNLMDRTDRRFKVVFAGLHNVQRATTQSNHPLAHFNDPICIGPLIDGGEARSAMSLIAKPFALLGYRFESFDLLLRILAYTNYYPSLIQLFCAQLLKYVSGSGVRFDRRATPPWVITSDHVEDAYHSQELWKQVKDRFQWTLQLDQRYEVIAYALALESKADPVRGISDGVTVPWIREQVLLFWAQGFRQSSSEEALRILADEMVGLGLLRPAGSGRYALRNTNVLALMGSERDIEAALEREREPPSEYQAAAFRSSFRRDGHVDEDRRNPLTALQEERLRSPENEVLVVCGTAAAGIADVPAFVEMSVGPEFFHRVKETATAERFWQHLTEVVGRRREGVCVLYVPADVRWDLDWASRAMTKMKATVRTKDVVKVVFEADPRSVWHMLHLGQATVVERLREKSVMSLAPWKNPAVRQRLEDSNTQSDSAKQMQLLSVTGNWHLLLDSFFANLKGGATWDGAIAKVEKQLKTDARWRAAFGLDVDEPAATIIECAGLGTATVGDLAAVLDLPESWVRKVVAWADLLGLVQAEPEGRWTVDPVVRRVAGGATD